MRQQLDQTDRHLINLLQDGIDVVPEPFAPVARQLGISVDDLLSRIGRLKAIGVLSRFGPMFNAARMGGGLTLCAMAVPQHRLEDVAKIVNGFPEVAHNYERQHRFNMWFVLATENQVRELEVIAEIEGLTGVKVLNLPKLEEYFIGMKIDA